MLRLPAVALIVLFAVLLSIPAFAQRRPEHRATWDTITVALEDTGFALTGCGTAYNDSWAVCAPDTAPLHEIDERIEAFWASLGIDLGGWGERPLAIGDTISWDLPGGTLRTEFEDLADGTPWIQVLYLPDEEHPAPANDNYRDATPIQDASGTAVGTNRGAWTYRGEPDYFYDPEVDDLGAPGVWWTWTAPRDGRYAFETRGSSFDSLLHVYRPNNDLDYYPDLSLVGRNDDADDLGYQSRVTFNAIARSRYYVRVGGYGDATGDITLSWSRVGGANAPASTAIEPRPLSAEAQALTSGPENFIQTAEECTQTVVGPRTFGAWAVILRREPTDAATIHLTLGVVGYPPVFGIEAFLWAETGPEVLDLFDPGVRIGGLGLTPPQQDSPYPIVETLYARNNELETFTVEMPIAHVQHYLAERSGLNLFITSEGNAIQHHIVDAAYLEVLANRFGQRCF